MRGNLKSDKYFEEKLISSDGEIVHYEELVARVCAVRGENDIGVQNGYGILTSAYQNRINLLYTSGIRDSEILANFEKLLQYYAKIWESDDSYFELIKVLALAILLDINFQNTYLALLRDKIRKVDYADYLVDFFLNNLDTNWKHNCFEFKWENTYEKLKDIVDCKNKSESVLLLKDYLDNQWYNIHKECAWYNTHKSTKTTYYGYWSFESGALAKILKLDDALLKNQSYYPYDLAHWK